LRLQKRRREEEHSGLRAEGAAGGCHRERLLPEEYHDGGESVCWSCAIALAD
jgi:hypothetical protein